MGYKLIRIDGNEDNNTTHCFENYSEAYHFLERIYGDSCCSDADYDDITYYDIVENK